METRRLRRVPLPSVSDLMPAMIALFTGLCVVSYGVASRTREIGLRMALGATQANVLRLISREGLRLTLIGVSIGLLLSVLVALGLSRVLFGVRPFDPSAYLGVITVLLAVSALACWLPARRATRVNPIEALRAE